METTRDSIPSRYVLLAATAVFSLAVTIACSGSPEKSEAPPTGASTPATAADPEAFETLSSRLERESWAPAYFEEHVRTFEPSREEPALARAGEEPYTQVEAGRYTFRTSPARIELGRRLFLEYDWGTAEYWSASERYIYYSLGLTDPRSLSERYGILLDDQDFFVGLVARSSPDGRTEYGWSCAICHATLDADGSVVPGAPNHRYDYGAIHHRGLVEHTPRPAEPGILLDRDAPVADLDALGPGRIDLNGDRIVNPVKIPSLWGLTRIETGMFATGSVGNLWLGVAHNGGPFPASELLEPLVAYVLSLSPPPNPRTPGDAETRGEGVFRSAGCATCHSGPDYTNGKVVPLDEIGTDPARARVEFPKGYRVPSLRRLDLQRLFLHDGSVTSLEDLFSRERLRTIPGHEYGMDRTDQEKRDLVAFLLSL